MTDERIKILFDKTRDAKEYYMKTKEQFGYESEYTKPEYVRFTTLYSLIESMNLENEYYEYVYANK